MKIIITEVQFKLCKNRHKIIMSLRDLSVLISERGYGEESIDIFHEILINKYKRYGDEGVIEVFKGATGMTLEPMSRGKYILTSKTF